MENEEGGKYEDEEQDSIEEEDEYKVEDKELRDLAEDDYMMTMMIMLMICLINQILLDGMKIMMKKVRFF